MKIYNPNTKKWEDAMWDGKKKEWKPLSTAGSSEKTAPAKTEQAPQEEKRTWFKKSKGNAGQTILGTADDVNKNFWEVIIGAPEKIGKGLFSLGATLNEQQQRENLNSQLMYGALNGANEEELKKTMQNTEKYIDDVYTGTSKTIAKDWYDEEKATQKYVEYTPISALAKATGTNKEEYSVLGERSDGVVQSASQLALTVGLQAVGVPWWVTTGSLAFGGEVENAVQQGASLHEAQASGLISAGAEILTEKLSGGIKFGGRALDDVTIKPLINKISSKTIRTLANYSTDLVGEGLEEVASSVISNLGTALYREENLSEILASEEALDGYIESFIGGAVLSGGINSGKAVNSIKTGRDYNTGLTQDEQGMIDSLTDKKATETSKQKAIEKEVEKAIAERETSQGGALSNANKEALKQSIISKIDNGEIDISSYELSEKERAKIQQEVQEDLEGGKYELSELEDLSTAETTSKIKDLEAQLENAKTKEAKAQLENAIAKLRNDRWAELQGKAKQNKFLGEAVYEKTQQYTNYTYDKTKVKDTFEQETRDSATTHANNTKKTRQFVDSLSKLAKAKQTSIRITNNQELLEQGDLVKKDKLTTEEQAQLTKLENELAKAKTDQQKQDIQNQIIELTYLDNGGLVRTDANGKKTVLVNIDSKQAMYEVVGHETRHLLEEDNNINKTYNEKLFAYAEKQGDLEALRESIKDTYNTEDVDLINSELSAKLTGKYLFENPKFLENIINTSDQTTAQKIVSKIKEVIDDLIIHFKGTEQEKQLREIQKNFKEMYKQYSAETNTNTEEKVQYALQNNNITKDTDIPYVVHNNYHNVAVNDNQALAKLQNDVRQIKRGTFENKATGYKADITSDTIGKIINPTKNFNAWNPNYNYIENLNASLYLPELFENAVYIDSKPPQKTKNAGKQIKEFHHFVAPIDMNNGDYRVLITAREKVNSNTLYVVKAEILPNKKRSTQLAGQTPPNMLGVPRTTKIADLVNGVNIFDYNLQQNQTYTDKDIQFSESDIDSDYMRALQTGDNVTAQKMVDEVAKEKGYTIKAYHGTNADFFTFDKGRVGKGTDQYGAGFYFASDKSASEHYGSRVIDSVLKLENPYTISSNNLLNADITLTEEEAYEVVKRHPMIYDADESPLGDFYDSYWEDGAQEWMIQDLATKYTDLGYLDSDLFRDYPNELHEAIRDVTGHDGLVVELESGDKFYIAWFDNQMKTSDVVTRDENGNVIPLSERFDSSKNDIRYSLSDNQDIAPVGNRLQDLRVKREIAPPVPNQSGEVTEMVGNAPSIAPSVTEQRVQAENEAYNELFTPVTEEEANAMLDSEENWERTRSLQEAEEMNDIVPPIYSSDTARLSDADLREVRKSVKDTLPLQRGRTKQFDEILQRYSTSEFPSRDALFYEIKDNFGKITVAEEITDVVEVQKILRSTRVDVSDNIKKSVTDYVQTMRRNFGKIRFAKDGMPVDVAYQELSEMYPNMFPEDITNEVDQFEQIVSVANMVRTEAGEYEIDDATINDTVNSIMSSVRDIRQRHNQNTAERRARWFDKDISLEQYMQTDDYEALTGNPNLLKVFHERWDSNRLDSVAPITDTAVANILETEPQLEKKGFRDNLKRKWAVFKANFIDKGAVFEDLAKVTKNRNLEAKWDYTMLAEAQAQYYMQNGDEGVKSLDAIREEVDNTGYSKEFSEYMYHNLNVDRMTLEERYGIDNKAVFGKTVTAGISQQKVAELETAHPEFKAYAQDVYDYMSNLRERMVSNGIISQETADLWSEMYPHYVPIRRVDSQGLNVNVPLATNRTSVNAPVKQAKGGSTDILPLFDTIGQRTMQTFKAINKNDFGIELKNTLGSTVLQENQSVDSAIDMVETQEELLQAGKNGYNPTFTVFENGERVTFEITQEMYEALLPMSDLWRDFNSKTLQKVSSFHRGVLTEYNPVFALTNGIKDFQDIFINSQHPAKTYFKIKEATLQLLNKGQWYQEYMKHGGENNSYFDTETNSFAPTKKGILDTFPLKQISNLNNFIERVPRLAEYIASREMGRSVQESMLDSARVTTNFKAGGDVTKWANRNGATFLNASVQGANQQVRNVREANMNGLKGWGLLATRFAVAGLLPLLLNKLLWDDDEEYEELSDYVKQSYYVVGKYGDGQFIRIPKGRTVAVIQEAFNQMDNLVTGNDEADLNTFLDVLTSNIAPNNPLSNNVFAPIGQALANKTWFKGDLVPQRLQDLPSAEQYDESTDSISKAIGQALNISPMKVNYVLDQYTGLVGDMILPALTPEVTNESEKPIDYLIAPLKDKLTTDGVMNKQVITDFYDKSEELTKEANKSTATHEDVLKNKYLNSVKAEMNELYKQKRELQNSDLPNKEKYAQVREVQRQISELAKEGMDSYENVEVFDNYATVGDRQYRWYQPEDKEEEPSWKKLTYKQIARQEKVTAVLGITYNDYWSDRKEEYDYAYDYPGKYGIAKAVGGYESYKTYSDALNDIVADKNANGQTISNSRKTKVVQYINNLNADYYTKIMLMKKEYPSDDRYNYEIVEYLNSREDISYQEMVDILTELDFKVSADGTIRW